MGAASPTPRRRRRRASEQASPPRPPPYLTTSAVASLVGQRVGELPRVLDAVLPSGEITDGRQPRLPGEAPGTRRHVRTTTRAQLSLGPHRSEAVSRTVYCPSAPAASKEPEGLGRGWRRRLFQDRPRRRVRASPEGELVAARWASRTSPVTARVSATTSSGAGEVMATDGATVSTVKKPATWVVVSPVRESLTMTWSA